MTQPSGVIFDFDGILADTERLHLRAYQDVFRDRGWALDEASYFERYLGYDDRAMMQEFSNDHGLGLDGRAIDAVIDAKSTRYRAGLATANTLFPGAKACVDRLAARFALGIASGSPRIEIETILTSGGLRDRFRVIVGADDVARSKPAADPYAEAITRLGVPARAAVAIEDSVWGLESARAAGLATIGVATSYPRAALAVADAVVDSLDEVTVALVERVLPSCR